MGENKVLFYALQRERERKCPRLKAVTLMGLLKELSTVEWASAIFSLAKLCITRNGMNF